MECFTCAFFSKYRASSSLSATTGCLPDQLLNIPPSEWIAETSAGLFDQHHQKAGLAAASHAQNQ